MDEKKQEAYMKVRDELLETKEEFERRNGNSEWTEGLLDGLRYALVVIDNLILQDRMN